MHRNVIASFCLVLAVIFGTSLKAADIVFDNSSQTVGGTVSTTDLTAVYGDFVSLTQTGKLSEFQFAVFCSGSSTGNLVSATVTLSFYDYTGGTIGSQFGSFTTNIGALAIGTYGTYPVTQLDSLNINLNSTDIFITQQLSNVVGSSRMGIPITYTSTTTAGANLTTGFYRIASGTTTTNVIAVGQTVSNAMYKVSVASVPEPSSTVLTCLALAGFAASRVRRRRTI